MAIDYSEIRAALGQGGGQPQQRLNWSDYQQSSLPQDFNQLYNLVSQMNQGQTPWLDMQRESQDYYAKQRDEKKYRQMTDLERFSKGAHEMSDFLGNALGNALFGEVSEGVNPYEIKPENAPRFIANLPGMIVGSIPDIAAYGTELAANAPVQEADSSTGLIEDRTLTDEERWGDIGYLGLSAAGFLPGLGLEARAGGLAAKALGAGVKTAGKEAAAEAISGAGRAGIKGTAKSGFLESAGEALGKSGKDLNPYRWGDALLETGKSTLFEGAQEAGQEYFQMMREGELDPDSPWGLNQENAERLQQAGFWGSLGGLAFGGATSAGSTALENSRANRGLDRYGNPLAPQTPATSNKPASFYHYAANADDVRNAAVAPEVQSWMTDEFGKQDARTKPGMSFKGVPGPFGQRTHTIIYGTRGIKRAWNAAKDDAAKKAYAGHWGMEADDFANLMLEDDNQIAKTLDKVAKDRMADAANVGKRIVLTSSKPPFANPNSMMTFFVGGVTPGNTVSFAPGVTKMTNADLDGDAFTLLVDDSMGSWKHLPTRRLMGTREMPATNKEGANAAGTEGLGYGEPWFGFEQAGIRSEIFEDATVDLSGIFEKHGFTNRQTWGYWSRKLQNAFKVSDEDKAKGVTWKHQFTKVLNDMVEYFNGLNQPLLGDDIASDVIAAYSMQGSEMLVPYYAAEAYGVNGEASPEIESTLEGVPLSPGAVPDGKIAITQFMEYLGYVTHGISSSGNPMFRFKQMGAWMQKLVKMTRDVAESYGVHDINDVEAVVKWSMQMVNDLHLPIDYAETLFKAAVIGNVRSELGMDGTEKMNRIGSGITYDQLKESIKKNWNGLAKEYKDAAGKYLTTQGVEPIDRAWNKTIVDDGEKNSYARAIIDLFGDWAGSAIGWVDDGGLTLSGMVEAIAADPFDYNITKYDYVGGGFSSMIQDLVDDFEGSLAAQTSSVVNQINSIAEHSTKGAVKFDDDGHASWDAEYEIENVFRAGWIIKLLGVAKALYLSVPGAKFMAKSGWARYIYSNDPEMIKRGVVAMGVRYNWREYIAAREAGNVNADIALNTIDFSNPLNLVILRMMLKEGKKETGIDGSLSDKPLEMFTDPSRMSYTQLSDMFDENIDRRVRTGSDMLLYYALDDGETVITGSTLGTRATDAKTYVSAIEGNTPARARAMWEDLKHGVSRITGQTPELTVEALRFHATSSPDVISLDAYAAACHDAAFFQSEDAEKSKSPRGASLHAQSVSLYEGGYSAAFLNQLGVSVGTLSEGVSAQISNAIRSAVFDSSFATRISIGNGRYVHISQAEIFGAVGKEIGEDGPTWTDLQALFDECPQILMNLLPQTYMPLSADADTVTPMLISSPKELVEGYISDHDKYEYRDRVQSNKVRNKIVSDQDSTILTFGYLDMNYDALLADGAAWKTAVEDAVNEWTNAIYSIASIQSDSIRRHIVESSFGSAEMREIDMLQMRVDDLTDVLIDMKNRVEEADANRTLANIQAEVEADRYFESVGLGSINLANENLSSVTSAEEASAQSEVELLRSQMEMEIAALRYGVGEITGDNVGKIRGIVSDAYIAKKRAMYQLLKKDGKISMTDDEFEAHAKAVQSQRYAVNVDKTFVSRQDIMPSSDPETFISKVVSFIESGNYSRIESEYWEEIGSRDEWEARVRKAFEENDQVYLEKQLRFWDSEMIESKIQDLRDMYGVGTAVDFLSRMRDAKDFVEKMVDEVRMDPTITPKTVVDPEKIMLPRISFNNPATSPNIEFASVEFEGGMNPVSSGQNAGNYQYLSVLDFIGKDFSCPNPPRTGLTRKEAIELANGQMNSLNVVNDDGSITPLTASELEDVRRFPDDKIAAMKFAPNKDCLIGTCHVHSAPSIVKAPGDYLGGRVTLAELAFFLSEKRVFQSKKKRHVFEKITHTVKHADNLKNYVITGRTREEILEGVIDYQEELAGHIRRVFIDENMADEFSLDDARVVAQFMTPMIEISYIDSTGKLKRATVAKFALTDDARFAEAVKDVDMAAIASIEPVPMSILDVCKKMLGDVRGSLSDSTQAKGGKTPSYDDLNKAFTESMYSWSGKAVDERGLLDFMQGTPVIKRKGNPSVLLGSSPNLMQNLMTNIGSLNKIAVRDARTAIENSTYSADEKDVVKEFNKNLDITPHNLDLDMGIAVVDSKYPQMYKPESTSSSDREIILNMSFPKVRETFRLSGVKNAVLIPRLDESQKAEAEAEFYNAKASGRVLLVPQDTFKLYEGWFDKEVTYSLVDGTVDVNVNGTPVTHVVLDPYVAGDPIQQNAVQTFISYYYPEDVAIDFADPGIAATDDSGYMMNPEYADMKMHFDDDMVVPKKTMIGKNLSKRMRSVLSNRTPFLVKLDDETRADIKAELEKAKSKDTVKDSRFMMPDWDSTYALNDDVTISKVEEYLALDADQLQPNGIVKGKVIQNQCIGIVSFIESGDVYYAPVILNTGGMPIELSSVRMSNGDLMRGEVKISWSGNITPRQYEGIKKIFEGLPYKAYGSVMDDDTYRNRMIRPGFNASIMDPRTGKKVDITTMGMYSQSTEEGRYMDRGLPTKIQNMFGATLIKAFSVFHVYEDGKWSVDRAKLKRLGWNDVEIDLLTTPGCEGVWDSFIYGNRKLHEDEDVNSYFRIVAKNAKASGLPVYWAFSNIDSSGRMVLRRFNPWLVYRLKDNAVDRFFHALDPSFAFDGRGDIASADREGPVPWVDKKGWVLGRDGKYHQGHIHFTRDTDDSTMLGQPTARVKYGAQQAINIGLLEGFDTGRSDVKTVLDYALIKAQDPTGFMVGGKYVDKYFDGMTDKEAAREMARVRESILDKEYKHVSSTGLMTRKASRHRRKIMQEARAVLSRKVNLLSTSDNTQAANLESGPDAVMYNDSIDNLRSALNMDRPLTELEIHRMFRETTASTYNNGNGSTDVTVKQFCSWINEIASNIRRGLFPFETQMTMTGRPIIGMVDSDLLDRMMTGRGFIDQNGQTWTRDAFVKAMEDSVDKTLEYTAYLNPAQREALYTMIDVVAGTYGKPWLSRPLGDTGVHLGDVYDESEAAAMRMGNEEGYEGLAEMRTKSKDFAKKAIETSYKNRFNRVYVDGVPAGFLARLRAPKRGDVWDSMSAVARIWAVVNPSLPISSIVLRFKAQGMTRGLLMFERLLPDGTISDNPGIEIKNKQAVKAAAQDPINQKIWRAFNVLSWSGEDIVQLQNVQSVEDFEKLIDERMKNMTWFERKQAWLFDKVSGGGVGVPFQIENFLYRFGATTNEENAPWLTERVDGSRTRYEQFIEENPSNLLIDLLTIKDSNPDYFRASQARNFVLRGEHAAQSMFGLVLSHWFTNHPMGEALMITGLCRFPHYAYNVGGWFLNHVAPVSTVAYIIRDLAIKKAYDPKGGKLSEYLQSLGVERTQVYTSLREALMVDAMTMGSTMLAGMLFGMGLMEPPDDEYYDEYAGNPGEWTVCGFRVSENWWIMDILGPFGAVAATWASIEHGKPRFDLMQNWMSKALWSNPVMKAADVARSLIDPTEQYLEEYENIAEQYANVEGGAPDMLEAWLDDQVSFGLNWFGQFVTPSFVREIGTSREFLKYERSYKKVEDDEGNLVNTDYLDAKIRKVTRSNPVLGLIMNVATGFSTNTGYVGTQMPEVRIPDQNQIGSMEYFSLYWPDGTEKDESYKMVTAFEVIGQLMSTDDMDALYNKGFVIPNETRVYVSQMLNDIRQCETDAFNAWVQETGTDAYIVGNGDFTEGMKRISEIKSAYYDDLRNIDKVFDKLWSDELSKGLQYYYREATNYERTRSGEYYATGYRDSINPLMPVLTAPGTYNAPIFGTRDDGTMGRSGNWETPSEVVEGASAGGRALVPIEPKRTKKPKLEDFADDKNGGYSDTEAGKAYANAAKEAAKNAKTTKVPSGGGGGGGYGGGGGGGGSRGGGAPNTYAPSVSLPKGNSSRIMTRDRKQSANLDYLRPDFETKGSREAYKRSDI